MEHPPLRSCSEILASWSCSPHVLHTRARRSVNSIQYIDSPLKSTRSQSLSGAQLRRAYLWSRVKGIRMHALLHRRPLWHRRLRTVCAEMLTPTAFLNSFRRVVVAFTKGWRLTCTSRNRSFLGVVARCRPPEWRWVAEPDVWKRCHALLITHWLKPNILATICCEDPHSSIPIALDNYSVVNRSHWRRGGIHDLKCVKKNSLDWC